MLNPHSSFIIFLKLSPATSMFIFFLFTILIFFYLGKKGLYFPTHLVLLSGAGLPWWHSG